MKIKKLVSKINPFKSQYDDIHVQLNELDIKLTRVTNPEIPHEVTVVVPRAEIRERYNENNQLIEREIILNSITVVHAPRHPLAGPPAPPPEIPERLEDKSHNFIRKKQP